IALLALAHQDLPGDLRKRYPLLVGGGKWQDKDADFALDPYIQLSGFIADTDLAAVYQGATIFAFPSKYEGFGLPVLEAMVSGVPVLTSNASSLPEVAGDAAYIVDPESLSDMTTGLKELLTNKQLRESLIEKGHTRTEMFSWTDYAKTLHRLLVR
ncbi:MAG: glycosyltransferase family 1 protein, partial [Candidatus Saccharibacteria bacterium]